MKAVAALLALAAGVLGAASNVSVEYVTVTTDKVVYFCPEATTVVHNGATFSADKGANMTITGDITAKVPVTTILSVECHFCANATGSGSSPYNSAPSKAAAVPSGTGSATKPTAAPARSSVVTAGGSKAVIATGAGLVGVLGAAVFLL